MNEVGIWFEKTQVQDSATRGLTSLCKFKNQLYKKYIDRSSRVDNFTISRNFQLYFFSVFLLFEFEVLEDHNENYWFYQ